MKNVNLDRTFGILTTFIGNITNGVFRVAQGSNTAHGLDFCMGGFGYLRIDFPDEAFQDMTAQFPLPADYDGQGFTIKILYTSTTDTWWSSDTILS